MSLKPIMCVALLSAIWAPAYAYRPFDGSDAGTAEPGVFELEFGSSYLHRDKEKSLSAPAVTGNFGFAGDTELVLEGRLERQFGDFSDTRRTSFSDTAFSVKHVFRRGSLQDGSGPSIAAECGVLLPTIYGQSGTGATCNGIVSGRGDAGAVHLNAALTRTREHTTSRFLGVILEGPEAWLVRPVMEIFTERDATEPRTNSILLGAIWKHSEDLSFDFGVRRGHSGGRADGENITELRVGLDWSFHLAGK
ncbi:hypothetical protein [Collimonas sp. OK607]|uniref:hypothetical protein n=1 Tax=Collimonas sp. OK607 TaxID=1798194 RepID=UPI001113D0CE|nr:hypothetical protein [Collimonas sp. OK607]